MTRELTDYEIHVLVQEVLLGNFGNGEYRKRALGEHYDVVQAAVTAQLNAHQKAKDARYDNFLMWSAIIIGSAVICLLALVGAIQVVRWLL